MNPYGRKRLPYPFSYRTELTQDSPDEFVSGEPMSESSCNWFVVTLDNDEKRKFTSALLAGLDLLYPDEFVYLFQLWLQPTEFPNTFPDNVIGACNPVDLCQLILECIQTTPEIQQAIGKYSLTSGATGTTPEQDNILNLDFVNGQPDCDNDKLYGMCLQLTDFLNTVSEDILEQFVTAFAVPSRLGDAIEAIPLIGELPVDDILQALEKLAEQVNDAYQAGYDTQIREDISCALFCLAKDDCQLSFRDARDYFGGKLIVPINDTDFETVMNDIVSNNWLGEQSIYVMHWLLLNVFIFGGEILGIDADRALVTVSTFFNDPNPDWSILCTECPWLYTNNWVASQDSWYLPPTGGFSVAIGNWVSGLGFTSEDEQVNTTQYWRGLHVGYDFASPTTITRFNALYNLTKGSYSIAGTAFAIILVGRMGGNSGTIVFTESISINDAVNGSNQVIEWEGEEEVDFIGIQIRSSQSDPSLSYSGSCRIVAGTVEGIGIDPFA